MVEGAMLSEGGWAGGTHGCIRVVLDAELREIAIQHATFLAKCVGPRQRDATVGLPPQIHVQRIKPLHRTP